jgi:urocanate hydratase
MDLLNKGLQHSIEKPLKTYWSKLIVENERPVKLLEIKLQNPYCVMANKKLKQIFNSRNHHNATQKRQTYIMNNLNHKLVTENAMIVRAVKAKP